jgi:hypothetical protein
MLYGIIVFALPIAQTKKRKLTTFPLMKSSSASFKGEIIEDYPADKPYPSCLVYGETFSEEPVHSVWAYNPENQWVVLITVYRPDPKSWIDWRRRRPKDATL